MVKDIEVHESIRQVQMLMSLYDHSRCGLNWFCNVVHRELTRVEVAEGRLFYFVYYCSFLFFIFNCFVMFLLFFSYFVEVAERKRLVSSMKLGLIGKPDVLTLLEHKLHLIILGTMIQSLKQIEHFDALVNGKQKEYLENEMMRLKNNMKYLVDVVIPHGLKMSVMLKGLNVDSSLSILSKYLQIARDIKVIEQWIVQPFNAEDNVEALVEWDNENFQYKLKKGR